MTFFSRGAGHFLRSDHTLNTLKILTLEISMRCFLCVRSLWDSHMSLSTACRCRANCSFIKCLSRRFLNWLRDWDVTTASGSEFQIRTTPWLKNLDLQFSLALSTCNLQPLLLVTELFVFWRRLQNQHHIDSWAIWKLELVVPFFVYIAMLVTLIFVVYPHNLDLSIPQST